MQPIHGVRRISLLTVLAMTASATYAWPARIDSLGTAYDRDRSDDRDEECDRYDRFDRSRWARDFRGRWIPLARMFSAETRRQDIDLRGQVGRFNRLRVEAERGAPVINEVAILYLDRDTQVVRLDVRLPRGAGEIIRLEGRRIQRIIVYADPGYGGSYSVYGV